MLKTKINTILLCTLFTLFFPLSAGAQYRNPILYADVPDMSVCRAGDYFYMVSTTMHLMPGAHWAAGAALCKAELPGAGVHPGGGRNPGGMPGEWK